MSVPLLDPTRLFDVSGLVVVVTGGGTGIGLMIATTLENNGAIVYIASRRLKTLEDAAAANNKHGNIIPVQCDLTSRESIQALVDKVKQEQGHINLLVNNSGVLLNKHQPILPTDDIQTVQEKLWNAGTIDDFRTTFDVNVTAVYYTTVAFLQLLDAGNKKAGLDAPSSQVITISSIGALRRDESVTSLSYGSSKAAVLYLGKTLANVLKRWNIRSNIIAPGLYPSEMSSLVVDSTHTLSADQVPLKRAGNIEDMGGLVIFLASRAGAYISGGVHVTDGGRLGLFCSTF